MKMALFLCLLFLVLSSAMACDRCVHQGKVTLFSGESALHSGACGYGSFAAKFNGGYTAAAISSIYAEGAGCGACFQIRCKDSKLCSKGGTKVVVTDFNGDNSTDFVLSAKAFGAMANKGKDRDIFKRGVADVEYKWIPCEYKNQNLTVRVEESSRNPDYLAITPLFLGGQTKILVIDVIEAVGSYSVSMSRNYGAVWDTNRVPNGAVRFLFIVIGGFDATFHWTETVLPADWKSGALYDTGVKINDIAKEACSPCDDTIWGDQVHHDHTNPLLSADN